MSKTLSKSQLFISHHSMLNLYFWDIIMCKTILSHNFVSDTSHKYALDTFQNTSRVTNIP